jgi:hypothetical protein
VFPASDGVSDTAEQDQHNAYDQEKRTQHPQDMQAEEEAEHEEDHA